jgi:hypothetical protein
VALARLGLICLDCEDPAGLAAFWAGLLGGEVTPVSDDVVVVKSHGAPVAAVRVPGYQPPTWPSGAIPKQVHLDLAVGDLDAAEAEAVRLGARRAGEQPRPGRWRVMLDPAGHPFCLCDWSRALPANRKDPDHGPVRAGAVSLEQHVAGWLQELWLLHSFRGAPVQEDSSLYRTPSSL